jgi:hypothetical protein
LKENVFIHSSFGEIAGFGEIDQQLKSSFLSLELKITEK